MNTIELPYVLEQARKRISNWVQSNAPEVDDNDGSLVQAVCDWANREYSLRLETEWDDGSSRFGARWVRGSSIANWFHQPLAGETADEAELVACANLLEVLDGLEERA